VNPGTRIGPYEVIAPIGSGEMGEAFRARDTRLHRDVALKLRVVPRTTRSAVPVLLADAGVEKTNAQVDELIATSVLRRLLAFTELKFSNSMIEAWWRFPQASVALPPPARQRRDHPRLVAFCVHEHNHVLPHSAFRRVEANRSESCETCPSVNAAA
jgi:hypothetical protein